jgi:hypothetical protein
VGHFTGGYIMAGVMAVLAIAMFAITRRQGSRPGEIVGVFGFGAVAVIELLTTVTGRSASANDAGTVEAVGLLETADGPRVVTLDVIEHVDILALLSRGGGGGLTWKEQRLTVFDLATGKRSSRASLEGKTDGPVTLVGGLGGFVIVKSSYDHIRILRPNGDEDAGALDTFAPKILAANPSFGHVQSTSYNASSQCLEVRTDAFRAEVDPRTFAMMTTSCKREAGSATQAVFDAHTTLTIQRIVPQLPPGAQPLTDATEGVVKVMGAPSAAPRKFENPRFATAGGDPLFVGDPRAALLTYGEDPKRHVAAITATGDVAWDAPLPPAAGDLVVANDSLVVLSSTKVFVIDAKTGKSSRELALE